MFHMLPLSFLELLDPLAKSPVNRFLEVTLLVQNSLDLFLKKKDNGFRYLTLMEEFMLQCLGNIAQTSLKVASISSTGFGLCAGAILAKTVAPLFLAACKKGSLDPFREKEDLLKIVISSVGSLALGIACTKLAYISTRFPSNFTSKAMLDSIKVTNWTELFPAVVSK